MKFFFFAFLFFLSLHCTAQKDDITELMVEKYLENTETSADYNQITEDLKKYLTQPIAINQCDLDELFNFPLLSQTGAIAIINHRKIYGYFLDINELQVVGFTAEEIRIIQPYITLGKSISQLTSEFIKSLQNGNKLGAFTVKQKNPIDLPDSILGDKLASSIRLRYYIPGKYSIGFTAEKDAGEAWWIKKPNYISGHLFIENLGKLKAFVVGDYLLSFGQGLVLGSGIGMSKSALVLNTRRNSPTLKPYRGTNEFQFLRGAAATYKFNKLELTLAAASNLLDAKLISDSNSNEFTFNNPDIDGLHRTSAELLQKGQLKRQSFGTWLKNNSSRGYWGVGYFMQHYSIALNTSQVLYKKYNPVGNSMQFIHAFQAHTFGRYHFFSEWAFCPENKSKAGIAGLMTAFGKSLEISLLWRNYGTGFIAPFSTSFGNRAANERGFYTGIRYVFSRKLSLSHYTDLYKSDWLSYRIWAPSRGTDQLWQLDYAPSKKHLFYIRYRTQNKPQALTEIEPVKRAGNLLTRQFRFHMTTPFSNTANLQLRIELGNAFMESKQYSSTLAFIQFSKSIHKTKFSVRYNVFNVPYFYNRIFAFETQLPFEFSSTAFYGTGSSAFLLIQQKIKRYWKSGIRAQWSSSTSTSQTALKKQTGLFLQLIYEH